MKRSDVNLKSIVLSCTFFSLFIFNLIPVFSQDNLTELIKKVQNNSQKAYNEIQSVNFEGHSTTYIYLGYGPFNVKMVPYLDERYFDGYWMKPDSLRIIIKARKFVNPDSGENDFGEIGPEPNPFRFLYDASALGLKDAKKHDSLKVSPIYPFALGADSLYHYYKISEVGFGENTVVTLRVEPKNSATPGVIGTFQIDKNRCEVVGSTVVTNEAASFTQSNVKKEKNRFTLSVSGYENHQMRTKKSLFYGLYWLPQTIEEEFEIKILGFQVKIHRAIEFDTYNVNPEKTDTSVVVNKKIIYESNPEFEKKLVYNSDHPERLSRKEQEEIIKKIEDKFSSQELYHDLFESNMLTKDAVRLEMEQQYGRYFRLTQQLGNIFRYNRVEGLGINYGLNLTNLLLKNSLVSVSAGYGLRDERFKSEAALIQYLDNQHKFFLETNLFSTLAWEEGRKLITTGKNTITSLLYKGDYRDYYYKIGGNLGFGYRMTDNLAVKLTYLSQAEKNAYNNTKFSLLKGKESFRVNPAIAEGEFRGFRSEIFYQLYHRNLNVLAEYTNQNWLHSDFSYFLAKMNFDQKFRLTYHTHLNLALATGMASGYLPPQRWFDFGGRTFLNFTGNFRGVNYKEFTGDRMASINVDYALNGGILYDKGIHSKFIRALRLNLWSGLGWSELSSKSKTMATNPNHPGEITNGIYHEFGVGLGDQFNILRFDFIRNSIRENKILMTFNFLR